MKLLALAAIGLALAAGVAAASSQADGVTLSLRQGLNENKTHVFIWYGQVASSAAGEDVEVLGRDCGTKDYRLYAATKTVAGGGWEIDNVAAAPLYGFVEVKSGTTFRARWRDQLSNIVDYRLPLGLVVKKIRGKRAWRVTVNPSPNYMNMKGRYVVLQRASGDKWVRYKRARLVHKPNYEYAGATNYEAVFEVPARGIRVRVLLPTKTAAPCYLPWATEPWRS